MAEATTVVTTEVAPTDPADLFQTGVRVVRGPGESHCREAYANRQRFAKREAGFFSSHAHNPSAIFFCCTAPCVDRPSRPACSSKWRALFPPDHHENGRAIGVGAVGISCGRECWSCDGLDITFQDSQSCSLAGGEACAISAVLPALCGDGFPVNTFFGSHSTFGRDDACEREPPNRTVGAEEA
jgi:hypothetical protein